MSTHRFLLGIRIIQLHVFLYALCALCALSACSTDDFDLDLIQVHLLRIEPIHSDGGTRLDRRCVEED